ncbi:MAG TPA: hypothetical protein VNI01_08870 [Elusimicrobiota bacterium]|jgi:lauroyl/myristoyl acyltransferase|nr:hypothetical protein [Elusimicrobiota bacterium]
MSFFGTAARAARRAPRPLLDFALERLLLRWGFFRHPARRRVILGNYRRILAFAGRDPGEAEAVLERSIPLYARLLISMLSRPEDEEFARGIEAGKLLSAVAAARARGRGVVVALSNFGFFAHALMVLFQHEVPMRIPVLRRASLLHLPHGWADSFLSVGDASRECLAALKRNEAAVILTMVNYMARRPTLELFGAPARLGYAPAALALSAGAPILPAFTVFEDGKCRIEVEPLLQPEGSVSELTGRLARIQERWIGRYPHLWHVYEDFWSPAKMDASYRFVRRYLQIF